MACGLHWVRAEEVCQAQGALAEPEMIAIMSSEEEGEDEEEGAGPAAQAGHSRQHATRSTVQKGTEERFKVGRRAGLHRRRVCWGLYRRPGLLLQSRQWCLAPSAGVLPPAAAAAVAPADWVPHIRLSHLPWLCHTLPELRVH